ncbi:MAG: FecR family protein [Flavobacterium sp.]|nr:MAG: FecR family protein [Flavobacterium sp.]
MEEKDIYLLITQYLQKQTSTEENAFLANWITASPENEQTFEEIKVFWLPSKNIEKRDSSIALAKLNAIIDEQEKNAQRIKKLSFRKWALLAASIAIIGSIGILMLSSRKLTDNSSNDLQQLSKAGEIKAFYLTDGTKITLGPKSSLQYPSHFEGQKREVKLVGEAYFEVSKNPHKPFTVHTKDLDIKVLGTHFNVNASKNERSTTVSLLEGKVNVNVVFDHNEEYQLKPGQELVLDHASQQVYQHDLDSVNVLGWMTKTLIFRNEKLSDAARKIEKMYGVKVIFDNVSTAETRVYAQFKNESIKDVLQTICATGDLSYNNDGNKIFIRNKMK